MNKAKSLQTILSVGIVIALVGAAGLFYLGLEQVRAHAIDVSHTVTDAAASENQVSELQTLQTQLTERRALVDKANQIYATQGNWQAQALKDVQAYANRAGVDITKTDFASNEPTAGAVPGASSGGNVMTVTLGSSTSYQKLLAFLDGIEGNIPKMQVSTISLKRVAGGNSDSIQVQPITIMVSTR